MSTQQILESFLNEFPILTPSQRRAWRYLQSLTQNYTCVFPSQSKIAQACNCSRDTINNAIKVFKKKGWIKVFRRGYTSCIYHLSKVLVNINTNSPKTFMKKNLPSNSIKGTTYNPTVINNNFSYEKNDIDTIPKRNVHNCELQKEIYKLSGKDKNIILGLQKKDPKAILQAIDDLKNLRQKERVKNPAAVITARFKKHSNLYQSEPSEKVPEEIRTLNLPQKDSQILSKYFSKNTRAFMLALEDFKTYSLVKNVGNIAAFITSRFFAYLKGKIQNPKSNQELLKKIKERKEVAQMIEKSKLPQNVKAYALDKRIEFSFGPVSKILDYDNPRFDLELNKLINQLKIKLF